MPLTNEQRKANEKWMESMIPISKYWMWKDEIELYEFNNNKIYPKTKKGATALRKIVSSKWARVNIVDP